MLRLYVKENASGEIHEYGTNKHDALILQNDGSLHYENMQCFVGTKFPKEGYSFCLEDGTIPEWDLENDVEPYIDIGGEYYTKPHTNADSIRAMSDEELAVLLAHETYRMAKPVFDMCGYGITEDFIFAQRLEWLQQPAEGG